MKNLRREALKELALFYKFSKQRINCGDGGDEDKKEIERFRRKTETATYDVAISLKIIHKKKLFGIVKIVIFPVMVGSEKETKNCFLLIWPNLLLNRN